MNNIPLVSIIIPVYNTEAYIYQCLKSCQEQDYSNLEFIVIDDGSTDNSSNIIKSFLDDTRFTYILKENGGAASARNRGIIEAKGIFLFFLDSDDYIISDAITSLVMKTDISSLDYVLSSKYSILDFNKKLKTTKLFKIKDGSILPHHFIRDIIVKKTRAWRVTGALYRADIIRNNNITFPEGVVPEDVFFNIDYVPHCQQVIVTDKPILYVRKRIGSVTQTYNQMMIKSTESLDKKLKNLFCNKNDSRMTELINGLYIRNSILTIYQDSMKLESYKMTKNNIKKITSSERFSEAMLNAKYTFPYFKSISARLYVLLSYLLLKFHYYKTLAVINYIINKFKKIFNILTLV